MVVVVVVFCCDFCATKASFCFVFLFGCFIIIFVVAIVVTAIKNKLHSIHFQEVKRAVYFSGGFLSGD